MTPVRALLVDDVVEVRSLVRTALRLRGGFEVVGEARDGAEAVRLAGGLHPDIVVLDLGLPDLTGRDVLTQVRDVSPESRVVVFSGETPDDEAWILGHVEAYLRKDARLDFLVDLLESVGQGVSAEGVLQLPRQPSSAGLARRFVRRTMGIWGLDALLDDALVVASELAANAVTHAGSSARLRLSLKPAALRIEVSDAGSGTPEPQPLNHEEENGRGLHLVGALAAAWGIEATPNAGKLVWAELARPRSVGRQSTRDDAER
jgi:CheY-like chemotaxis protein